METQELENLLQNYSMASPSNTADCSDTSVDLEYSEISNEISKVIQELNTHIFSKCAKEEFNSPAGSSTTLQNIWDAKVSDDNTAMFCSKFKKLVEKSNLRKASQSYFPKNINKHQHQSQSQDRTLMISHNNSNYNSNYTLPNANTSKSSPFECLKVKSKKSGRNQLDDFQNQISLENIMRGTEKRTTLMIRHIPNKYSVHSLSHDIDELFAGKYDLLYLPIDYSSNCNLGFAFINFVDPMHIVMFYEKYSNKKWRRFNSDKICELAFAKLQGKEQLINHFKRGTVLANESESKKPLILATRQELPKVEFPRKYLEAFVTMYPFAKYGIFQNTFQVDSF